MKKVVLEFKIEDLRKSVREYFNKQGEQKEEITNGDISKYMRDSKEKGGLGLEDYKRTIYRRLREGKTEFNISVEEDMLDISYEEKVKLAQEYLKEKKFSSGDAITYEEIEQISRTSDLTSTHIATTILNIDNDIYRRLKKGDLKTAKIKMNSKYDNLDLQEKVERVKKHLTEKLEVRDYSYEEIKRMSEELDIPVKTLLINIFNKDAQTYERLERGEIKSIKYKGEIPNYKDPKTEFVGILTKTDLEDTIWVSQEFIEREFEECNSKNSLAKKIIQVNAKIKEDREYLESKYDKKYIELLEKYKKDPIINCHDFDTRKKYYKEYQYGYINEIFEILKRNPRYGSRIENKKIIEIAEEFSMDYKEMFRQIFKRDKMSIDKRTILEPKRNIKLPNRFVNIMAEEIQACCDNVANKLRKTNDLNWHDKKEMASALKVIMISYGGNIIFNGEQKDLKEYVAMLGGYIRKVGNQTVTEMNRKNKELIGFSKTGKDESEIGDDCNKLLMDKKRDTATEAIRNVTAGNVVNVSNAAELVGFDLEMLELLVDDDHVLMLEEFAKKLGIEPDSLRKITEDEITWMRGE